MSLTHTLTRETLLIMTSTLRERRRGRLLLSCGIVRARTTFGEAPHEQETARNSRRTGCRVTPLECARRFSHELGEAGAERSEARVADGETDLRHGEVRRSKQVLRPLDASLRQVARRRHSVHRLEQAVEVEFREPGHRRDVIEFDRLGEMPIDVIPRLAQVDQHVTRRPHRRRPTRRCYRDISVRGLRPIVLRTRLQLTARRVLVAVRRIRFTASAVASSAGRKTTSCWPSAAGSSSTSRSSRSSPRSG